MKTVHWIAQRDMRTRYDYKPLCSGEKMRHPDWQKAPSSGTGWHRKWEQPKDNRLFTNSEREVSCPECIRLLIMKFERSIANLNQKLMAPPSPQMMESTIGRD